MQVTGTRFAFEGARCPFDAVEFNASDRIVLCPECHTPHHAECWDTQQGCTQFGCKARGMPPIDPAPVPADAGAILEIRGDDNVPCSFCGETIKAVARKCKHCGEYLDPQLRRQRAQYLIPVERELPTGARILSTCEAAFGSMVAILCAVGFLVGPSIASLVAAVIGGAVAALGIGLNFGREWARRANEVVILLGAAITTLSCLAGMVTNPADFSGYVIAILFADASAAGLIWSLRSKECRTFCLPR